MGWIARGVRGGTLSGEITYTTIFGPTSSNGGSMCKTDTIRGCGGGVRAPEQTKCLLNGVLAFVMPFVGNPLSLPGCYTALTSGKKAWTLPHKKRP